MYYDCAPYSGTAILLVSGQKTEFTGSDAWLKKLSYKDLFSVGIDMANPSSNRSVDLIALATNDTDCIPAMKHARRSGLQVALITFPGYQPLPELLAHSDFRRSVSWP
jgi:hypothetical protein